MKEGFDWSHSVSKDSPVIGLGKFPFSSSNRLDELPDHIMTEPKCSFFHVVLVGFMFFVLRFFDAEATDCFDPSLCLLTPMCKLLTFFIRVFLL